MKLRQHVGSLVALVVAIAAGAGYLLDRGTISDVERRDRAHDVFPAYRRADIEALELVIGGTKLRIEKRVDADGGDFHWQLTSPVVERTDPAAVDRLIGDLEFAGVVRKVDGQAPEILHGFDAPRVRGTLSMKTLVYHFALGGPAPLPEGAAYFRVDGEGTFVVSKDFVTALTNGPDAYRDRTVVPYLSLDLAELEVSTPTGGFSLTRVDDVSFKLKGTELRASRELLDKVWGALAEARAETFLRDNDADRALGPAAIKVRMTPKDRAKPVGELLFGGACPAHAEDTVLVRMAPSRVSACVPKGALPGLETTADALVDRRLFAARADEVEEVSFEALPAGLIVELARKGHGWHERKPSDRELASAEVDAMNDLIAKITRGEAVETMRPGEGTTFEARARVRLKRGNGGPEEVVDLDPKRGLVRRSFDGALLRVSPALGRRLVPSEIALRGRTVFETRANLTPTAVRTACDGVRQSVTRSANQWTMSEPRGFAADPLATADLVGLIRNAQAESWVADGDDGSFGFAEGACQVEVDLGGEAGRASLVITFGREAENGAYYARTSDGPAVFLAPRALREGATTWLIDRNVFRADRASVERIVLSRGASRVVLGGGREQDDGGSNATSRVLGTLQTLRPDAVIHLGEPLPNEGFREPTLDVRVSLAGDGGRRELHLILGNTALVNRERLVYARVSGIDATYGIARDRVTALVDAL